MTKDTNNTIPTQYHSLLDTLASLRLMVLSHLSDLEARLALLDLLDMDVVVLDMDVPARMGEARTNIAKHGLELLHNIREDVVSYLPDFSLDFDNLALNAEATRVTLRARLKSKLPDLAGLQDKLPDLHVPDLDDVRAKFPDMPSMDDIRTRLSHLDLSLPDINLPESPLAYLPTLQLHLQSLHTHLQDLAFSFPSASERCMPGPASLVLNVMLTQSYH